VGTPHGQQAPGDQVVTDRAAILHALENQIVWAIRFHNPILPQCPSRLDFYRQQLQVVHAFNHRTIDAYRGIGGVRLRRTPIAAAVTLIYGD
jgi:hypothetical protein